MTGSWQIQIGEWVGTPDGVGLVCNIEEHHDVRPEVVYTKPVHVQFENRTASYKYIEVYRLKFLDFVFKGPNGKRGFGLSRWWEALAIHCFAVLLWVVAIVSQVQEYPSMSLPWALFTGGFGCLLIAVLWVKTYHNFTRRTV